MIHALLEGVRQLSGYLRAGLLDFVHTDFGQVHYGAIGTARSLAFAVLIAMGLTTLRRMLLAPSAMRGCTPGMRSTPPTPGDRGPGSCTRCRSWCCVRRWR